MKQLGIIRSRDRRVMQFSSAIGQPWPKRRLLVTAELRFLGGAADAKMEVIVMDAATPRLVEDPCRPRKGTRRRFAPRGVSEKPRFH